MGLKQGSKSTLNNAIIKEIRDAVESLEYGTVAIKIHDSRIIQIEVTRRRRFDEEWKIEEGGGI